MSGDLGSVGLFVAFLVPPLLLGVVIQAWLRRTFSRYSQVPLANGLRGAQVAREILDRNGLTDVPVERAQGGRSPTTTTRASASSISPSPCIRRQR